MRRPYHLLTLLALLLTVACAQQQTETNAVTPVYGPKEFTVPPFTAVVVAYEPELLGVLSTIETIPHAAITEEVTFKGVKYRLGYYRDTPIVIFATGMSIANAALTMQMAFDYFPVEQVVYMGIAGAINPSLKPGDVIVPERWYYHDESVYANPNPAGDGHLVPNYYQAFLDEQPARRADDPFLPKYENFGIVHPDEVLVIKDGYDKPKDTAYFAATPRLIDIAKQAIDALPPISVSETRDSKMYVGGNGVTGSVFLDNRDYRKWVRKVFNAEVTEMESAAIGQVSYINDIDWVVIRAVSDLAGGQEGVNEEDVYDKAASIVGAKVLFEMLEKMAQKSPN